MLLKPFISVDESLKYTSYLLTVASHHVALDFGAKAYSDDDLNRIDTIILTHDHYDHFGALAKPSVVALIHDRVLSGSLKIYSTSTTKRLVQERIKKRNDINDEEKMRAGEIAEKIIPLLFFQTIRLENDDVAITLMPSFHTFGSAMIFIEAEECNLLYTGDLGEQAAYFYDNYGQKKYKVDYLLTDSTGLGKPFINNDFSDMRVLITEASVSAFRDRIEKLPFMANVLSNDPVIMEKHYVVYRESTLWYETALLEEGFRVFEDGLIYADSDGLDRIAPEGKSPIYLFDPRFEPKYPNIDAVPTLNQYISLHYGSESLIHLLSSPLFFKPLKGIYYTHFTLDYQTTNNVNYFIKTHPNLASKQIPIVTDESIALEEEQ
jgi:L-ascorbate metabolism protein UlaG (beta-lactamase superfamily)